MVVPLIPSIWHRSIFITQALFELALLSEEDLNGMRMEISDALESEGGWNKAALLKFKKVDSTLREVGRVYGLMHCKHFSPTCSFVCLLMSVLFFQVALPRFALLGCDLGDGINVPPGFRIAVDMKAVHFNQDVYPDAERCDVFRFSKLRDSEDTSSKYGFATVDSHVRFIIYLPLCMR